MIALLTLKDLKQLGPSIRQRSTNDSRQCSDITNTLNQRLFSNMVTMSPSGREFLNIKEDQVHLTFQAGK